METSRQPSPVTIKAASELLLFHSSRSEKINSSSPNVDVPASLANPNVPDTVAVAGKNAATLLGRQINLPDNYRRIATAAPTAAPMAACQTSPHLPPGTLNRKPGARRPLVNRPIDHSYTDYAPVSESELKQLDADSSILKSPTLSPQKKRLLEQLRGIEFKSWASVSFPAKLHAAISNPELSDIISWLPHGRAFAIHDPDGLVTKVLPRYFNQTKFVSFIRQCNLWGFKRLTRGVEGKVYYHELFLRGRPYMALRLTRHEVKGHGFKPMPNPAAEPQFYSYSQVGEEPFEGGACLKPVSLKENDINRSKKSIVMSRADKQVEAVELAGHTLIPKVAANGKDYSSVGKNDSNFLTAALARSVPPAATSGENGLSANSHPSVDVNLLATVPETKADGQDQIAKDALASLQYPYHDALSAANAPPLATFLPRTASQFPFIGMANYASFMGNSDKTNKTLLQSNAQTKADDFLSQRISQLQKQQDEIKMLRAQIMGTVPYQYLERTGSYDRFGEPFSPIANVFPFQPETRQPSSVLQAIREANYFEKLAMNSRNKARILALSEATDSDLGSK